MLNINAYGTLTNNDIISLEEKIGFQLPVDYRDFLIAYNGGKMVDSVFHVDELEQDILMNVFYGYNIEKNKVLNLIFWYEKYGDEIPNNSLLIGNDPGGGFLLYIHYGEDCGVYYYDDSYAFPQSSDEQNTYYIAETFQDFLSSLRAPTAAS